MIDRATIKARMEAKGITIADVSKRTGRAWQSVQKTLNSEPSRVERQLAEIAEAVAELSKRRRK